jgi:hypothetical protein
MILLNTSKIRKGVVILLESKKERDATAAGLAAASSGPEKA